MIASVASYADIRKVSQYPAVKNAAIPQFINIYSLRMGALNE